MICPICEIGTLIQEKGTIEIENHAILGETFILPHQFHVCSHCECEMGNSNDTRENSP
jgi:hypothetical protein